MLVKYTDATSWAKVTPPPPVEYGLEPRFALIASAPPPLAAAAWPGWAAALATGPLSAFFLLGTFTSSLDTDAPAFPHLGSLAGEEVYSRSTHVVAATGLT
jgi:hypothetical protein